jgi:tRNA dimethylallyltransferase
MDKVLVILGPTAIGKSELAIKLAKLYQGEIISADSRQVYKYLDIGTGKVTEKEMQGVPHYGIDIINPKKVYTVAEYQKYAFKKIREITKRGKLPIICGGTGFYIDAITQNFILPEVPANPNLRAKLNKNTPEKNFEILKSLDKDRAENIDNKNNVRLIRAIEIATALGKVPKIINQNTNYEFIKIGLKLDKEILDKKIETRVKKMFKAGLLEEIENLKKKGIEEKRLQEFGFEYNNPSVESVISETKKYVKRQYTYFKRDKDINWFSPLDFKNIKILISSKLF